MSACPSAASGCNYPEAECAGLCGTDRKFRRDNLATQDLLELVDITVDLGDIAQWSNQQILEAERYAMAKHYRASDNIVKVPPMPEHVRLAIVRAGGTA